MWIIFVEILMTKWTIIECFEKGHVYRYIMTEQRALNRHLGPKNWRRQPVLTTHALVVLQEFLPEMAQFPHTLRFLGSLYGREDGCSEDQEQDVEGREHQEAGCAPVQTNTAESRQLHVCWLPAHWNIITGSCTAVRFWRSDLPAVFTHESTS